MRIYDSSDVLAFATRAFSSVGLDFASAAIVADSLVEANLRGVDTHGVNRLLKIYLRRVKLGIVNPTPAMRLVTERQAAALLDADNAMGAVAGVRGIDEALKRAANCGVGTVAVRNSNHFGAAAHYALRAAENGCIGIAVTNAAPRLAPWGGADVLLGNNPVAYAIPTGDDRPMVLDISTSVVARGKIMLAARQKRSIPTGWALDDSGAPTTDPDRALRGLILPFGEHKGSGLSIVHEILTGVLAGGVIGASLGSLYEDLDRPQGVSHFFVALDPSAFVGATAFQGAVQALARGITASSPATGHERVYLPGEIEWETRSKRLKDGIPLPDDAVEDLQEVAQELGIQMPTQV
jgi:LDH2 family malate/lactate/ureidoglycolate dehydrogenase